MRENCQLIMKRGPVLFCIFGLEHCFSHAHWFENPQSGLEFRDPFASSTPDRSRGLGSTGSMLAISFDRRVLRARICVVCASVLLPERKLGESLFHTLWSPIRCAEFLVAFASFSPSLGRVVSQRSRATSPVLEKGGVQTSPPWQGRKPCIDDTNFQGLYIYLPIELGFWLSRELDAGAFFFFVRYGSGGGGGP